MTNHGRPPLAMTNHNRPPRAMMNHNRPSRAMMNHNRPPHAMMNHNRPPHAMMNHDRPPHVAMTHDAPPQTRYAQPKGDLGQEADPGQQLEHCPASPRRHDQTDYSSGHISVQQETRAEERGVHHHAPEEP